MCAEIRKPSLIATLLGMNAQESRTDPLAEHFESMLVISHRLYEQIMTILLDGVPITEEVRTQVVAQDEELNRLEESIRREVLVSMSSSRPGADIPSRMMFLGLIKNAERIGDYSKNMFKLLLKGVTILGDEYPKDIQQQRAWVSSAFPRMIQAYKQDDAQLCQQICDEVIPHTKRCDFIMFDLMKDPSLSRTPVATALLFRFHKRVMRHIYNICIQIAKPYKDDQPYV